jgi:hypothetical protein
VRRPRVSLRKNAYEAVKKWNKRKERPGEFYNSRNRLCKLLNIDQYQLVEAGATTIPDTPEGRERATSALMGNDTFLCGELTVEGIVETVIAALKEETS